jgi:hypothetical protein
VNESDIDTIKNLENFEETEFDKDGHESDHSEYQDSSSVDDEDDFRRRHSVLDNNDAN